MKNSGLRRRLLFGLLAYVAMLSVLVAAHGVFVNEHAERAVWQALLDAELDRIAAHQRLDPGYRWPDSDRMSMYDTSAGSPLPPELAQLAPGLHDEIEVGGREQVALVRPHGSGTLILTLDITRFEAEEATVSVLMAASAGLMVFVLGLLSAWWVSRLLQPLSRMASHIAALRPDRPGQQVDLPDDATTELKVIADALNGYLRRTERFVERERTFIDTASHELRTPIAVIAGATDLALQPEHLPAVSRGQLERIRAASRDIEQLITLLLVLAKDPARLADANEQVALDQLLPELVDDHRYLTADRNLQLVVTDLEPCRVMAPLPILQAAIGNLLRNAIESSDHGVIRVRLEAPATVVIEDPGRGMSPEEVSAIYSRVARGGGDRRGGGIGLDLISRLCEHFDWELKFHSARDKGTRTTLRLDAADAPAMRGGCRS